MKKLFKLILSGSLLFSLAACSSTSKQEAESTSSTKDEEDINFTEATDDEETIQAAAYAFLSDDTQCTEDLLSVTAYSSPSVGVHFYDVDQDGTVELLVMCSEEDLPNTYLVYDYNAKTGGFDLKTYFTNDPELDDGALSYSSTRGMLFTFCIAENKVGSYDCLIDYWSNDDPMTVLREIRIIHNQDGTYNYTVANWENDQWVEESSAVYKDDDTTAASWKDDAGEYVVLSTSTVSDFLALYE